MIRSFYLEFKKPDKIIYLVLNADADDYISRIASEQIVSQINKAKRIGFKFTRIIKAKVPTAHDNKFVHQLPHNLPNEEIIIGEVPIPTKIDILVHMLQKIDAKKKEFETRLEEELEDYPDGLFLGTTYGAFYNHTKSTNVAWKKAAEYVLERLKFYGQNGILKEVENKIEKLGQEHKSSLPTLSYFNLAKKSKAKKIWKEK